MSKSERFHKALKLMKQMIEDHKEQYGKEKYEEVSDGETEQGDEIREGSDPCPA